MQSFSGKCNTFASECKISPGNVRKRKVILINAILLRESENVLQKQSFFENSITFMSECNVSLSNAIFLQVKANFIRENQYICK